MARRADAKIAARVAGSCGDTPPGLGCQCEWRSKKAGRNRCSGYRAGGPAAARQRADAQYMAGPADFFKAEFCASSTAHYRDLALAFGSRHRHALGAAGILVLVARAGEP